jgi:hypothetical protein
MRYRKRWKEQDGGEKRYRKRWKEQDGGEKR